MKAIIYARCSTDESRQDVEVQLKELRRECERNGWEYDEVFEYGSGYKDDKQPKLDKVLERVRRKHYDVFLVFSLDRFSRQSPSKIHALLDQIVDLYKCRFIAIQQGIDSDNKMIWHGMKGLWLYFANKFSEDLSEKIRLGIKRKKEKGLYRGGRPAKAQQVDIGHIVALRASGRSLRGIAKEINENKRGKAKISYVSIQRLLQKHDEKYPSGHRRESDPRFNLGMQLI